MYRLSVDRRAALLTALLSNNGIRETSRITGANKATVLKFIAEAGGVARWYHQAVFGTYQRRPGLWICRSAGTGFGPW
jgi:hypothetical protein